MKVRLVLVGICMILLATCVQSATAQKPGGGLRETPEQICERLYDSLQEDQYHHPLKPPDTSSPRDTMANFLENVDRAYRVVMTAHEQNMRLPGWRTPEYIEELGDIAEILFERAEFCLDLSGVPKAHRRSIGIEATLKLKEILDRVDVPEPDAIPGIDAVAAFNEKRKDNEPFKWRLPYTDIVISEVQEGPRQGQYLFSPETVTRINDFYKRVLVLPYKSDTFVSKDFYEFYNNSPGRLLPLKWMQWLPPWANKIFYGQTIWQWAALILIIGLATAFSLWLFRRWGANSENYSPMKRAWGRVFLTLFEAGLISLILFFLDEHVNITSDVLIVIGRVLGTMTWVFLAWSAIMLGNAVAETVIASPKIDPKGLHASLIRIISVVTGFVFAAFIFFQGLDRLGVSLIPLLTGFGVGGLAIALAARPTLENLIGGIMILLDRPYRVGQRVKVQGHDGVVENIGFRSTQIRLLNGHQTIVPNEIMARMDIENIDRRPFIRRISNITITYDTPLAKVQKAVEIIRTILDNHQGMNPSRPPRVYFDEFNAESLNIYMSYWFYPPDYWAFHQFNQDVNLRIMAEFEKEGIQFAFPTTTTYLTQDKGQTLNIRVDQETKAAYP
jgi:MscS family membrane protein